MCDKSIIENGGTLKSVPYCYKNLEMHYKAIENYPHALELVHKCDKTRKLCDKAVNTYPSTIKFAPECFTTQKLCGKAFNRSFLAFHSIPDQQEFQEMHNTVFSEDTSLKVYCPGKYKTQRMCDKAVEDFLAALKHVPDWFVRSEVIKSFLLLFM